MTLLEVVIAFTILMVVLVPVATLLANVIGQTATARERLTALSIAEQWIETLNNQGPPVTSTYKLPETNQSLTETSKDVRSTVAYAVYAKFAWAAAQQTIPNLCTSGAIPPVMDLQVTVTWGQSSKITDTTIIDYPPSTLPSFGFLAVEVQGSPSGGPPADAGGHSWASRVQAVPVTLHSTAYSATGYPNSYGCLFQEVPTGSYTVSLADPTPGTPPGTSFGGTSTPSWVANENETTAPSQTGIVVSGGQITLASFQYDEGALVSVAYPTSTVTDGFAACPGAGTILCLATGQSPASSSSPWATPVADIAVRTSASSQAWTLSQPKSSTVQPTVLVAAACAGTTRCIVVGTGRHTTASKKGKSAAVSVSTATSSSTPTWSVTVPATVNALSGITCPTSTKCYAYGTSLSGSAGAYTTTAVVLSGAVTASGVTWTKTTFTSSAKVTRITSISCPSSTACYATAVKSKTRVLLYLSTKWKLISSYTTVKTFSPLEVLCQSTSECYAVGSGTHTVTKKVGRSTVTTSEPVAVVSGSSSSWAHDTLTTAVTGLTVITCPAASGATSCYAIGTKKSGTSTLGGAVSLSSTATKWSVDTTPSTATSMTGISCASKTVCALVATTKSGTTTSPAVLWRTAATKFTSVTLPVSVSSLDDVECVSTHCFVGGIKASPAAGVVLSGSSATGWSNDTLPATVTPVELAGIACTATLCAAPGESETSAFYLDGAPTATTWTKGTVSALQGMYIAKAPIVVTNASLRTSTPYQVYPKVAGTTDASQIGPFFPFSSGYSVAVDECTTLSASSAVSTTPGATTSATLPMGVLVIEAVNQYGDPDTGATVTITPSCSSYVTPLTGTNPTTFTMPATGALGLTELATMYGTYTVTVTYGSTKATAKVTLGPTSDGIVGSSSQTLPTPVVITDT